MSFIGRSNADISAFLQDELMNTPAAIQELEQLASESDDAVVRTKLFELVGKHTVSTTMPKLLPTVQSQQPQVQGHSSELLAAVCIVTEM